MTFDLSMPQGSKLFDRYSWRARVLPMYLSIAPVVLLLAAVLPDALKISLATVSALVSIPISYFLSQVGADFGKRLERALWEKWNGPPTTRFLRHGNREFNDVTRARIHEKFRSLGLHLPSAKEQAADPSRVDEYYASCAEEAIRRTRDANHFPLVFKGLTEYGFRRNLLGLKPYGLTIAVVTFILSVWSIYVSWSATGQWPPITVVATLMTVGLVFGWLAWVNEIGVRLTANRYARYLLEAVLDLELAMTKAAVAPFVR